MKFNIIEELIQGIAEIAVSMDAPTKKDREKYMKNAQITYGTRKKNHQAREKAVLSTQR